MREKEFTYSDRNDILKKLGYSSYSEYLESDLWLEIKCRVLKKNEGRCKLCNEVATVAHHIHYDKRCLLGKYIHPIVPVCRSCHKKIEIDENGVKRTLVSSKLEYERLLIEGREKGLIQRVRKKRINKSKRQAIITTSSQRVSKLCEVCTNTFLVDIEDKKTKRCNYCSQRGIVSRCPRCKDPKKFHNLHCKSCTRQLQELRENGDRNVQDA